MKVIKKINNNVAIGIDGKNREVVLFGKGVGFPQIPYELKSMMNIERTYYDLDKKYYALLNEIDVDLLNLIDSMMDVVKSKVPGNWNPSATFLIADHINFCLQRIKQGLTVNFPYSYEIETEFPEYNKMAKWIVYNINNKLNVKLEKGEITCIAMHLISASEGMKRSDTETVAEKISRILRTVTKIIEDFFSITVDKKNMNYYRFRYHIQYLVKRKELHESAHEDNQQLLSNMKQSYPDTYLCACKITEFLNSVYSEPCSENELLYLMIHINRLVSKN